MEVDDWEEGRPEAPRLIVGVAREEPVKKC